MLRGKPTRDLKHVNIPFRIYIPAGQTEFRVPVEKKHTDRDFFFTNTVLVPQFYSDQAADLNLDTDDEMDQLFTYPIHVKLNYESDFYGEPYNPSAAVLTPDALAKDLSSFYEIHKPQGLYRLGAFFDWTDIRFNPELKTWEEFVEEQSFAYYGEELDKKKHFNALPVSARTLPGVNNYLYPNEPVDVAAESLRFRINIAPNANLIFSTGQFLTDFGYDKTQIPEPNQRGQHVFPNASKNQFFSLAANDPSAKKLKSKAPLLRVRMQVNTSNFYTEPVNVSFKLRQTFINTNYETTLKNFFAGVSEQANLQYNVHYNVQTKIFEFSFPPNIKMTSATIFVPPELANRLGFGLITEITERNKTGLPVTDKPDDSHVQEKSRALCYDTGVVIVTDENLESFATSGVDTTFMTALYPTGTGTLAVLDSDLYREPATMQIHSTAERTSVLHARFKLWRFLDNNKLVPLVWKNGAHIYGVLRGVPSYAK